MKIPIIIISTIFLSFCTSNNKVLFEYINTYQIKKVAALIKKDPQLLYSFNDQGYTPLQQAIKMGDEAMLDLLMSFNAPLSLFSKKGESPLNIAIDSGYYNIIKKLLVQYKMDIHIPDKRGFTPLRTAYEEDKIEIMQLLMQHGAQKSEMFSTTIKSPTDNIPFIPFSKAETELVNLISLGDFHKVKTYIEQNPDLKLDATDNNKDTLLHLAAEQKDSQIITLLINKEPALVNQLNNERANPLMLATKTEFVDNARKLILAGSDLHQVDTQKRSLLHYAAQSNNIDMLSLILNNVNFVNSLDINGETPLDITVQNENLEMTQKLLEFEANPNLRSRDNGYTALHYAVETKNKDTIVLLLKFNASKTITDNNGQTPKDLANNLNLNSDIKDLL